MPKGDHFRKLQPQQIIDIRSSQEPTRILADRHNINRRYVRRIRQGYVWKTTYPD